MNFGLFFAMGAFIVSLAFSFLPVIIVMPQKFGLLFGVGSALMMASFGTLRGFKPFVFYLLE